MSPIYRQNFNWSSENNLFWGLFPVCPSCLQVTVNYRPARLPFSHHSLYVEDTGSMYMIQTPGGVSIQWYHSTGILVLQYITHYNASVPTRGLCGESTLAHTHTRCCINTSFDCINTGIIYLSASYQHLKVYCLNSSITLIRLIMWYNTLTCWKLFGFIRQFHSHIYMLYRADCSPVPDPETIPSRPTHNQ